MVMDRRDGWTVAPAASDYLPEAKWLTQSPWFL
ncbi:MAG: hypothetical protein QOD98_643 [Nocardioidaceae bacterium]|nr:hypothetical protein [Nocardioidaceae bacterium]